MRTLPAAARAAEGLARLCFPRRCPFCNAVLGGTAQYGVICPDCAEEAAQYEHTPPRLPETEHGFYAVSGAAGAYYYAGPVRRAILRCKNYGHPWYAQELADLIALRVFAAEPGGAPGKLPRYTPVPGLPAYDLLVPVPASLRRKKRGYNMPALLAGRLGKTLSIPVAARILTPTRETKPQKELAQSERFANQKDAYRAARGAELEGKRVLLIDDVITTGATVSACAKALLEGGAASVFAVSVAADEEMPKAAQKKKGEKAKTP